MPTLKLIQAARTKEISTSRNRWIALEEGPTRISRLRLERKKKRKPTRIHSEVVGTKNLLTGLTLKNVVRTKKYDCQELRGETQSEPRNVIDRNYVEGRSQNHSNTNQFLREIGCNV